MIRNLPKNSRRVLVLLALAATLPGLGCKKQEQPPPPPPKAAEPPKPQEKPVQQPSSSVKLPAPANVAQFDFSQKKDPFKPYVVVKPLTPASGPVRGRSTSQLPIHSFDVNQFKLIGVVTGAKESQAMVTDPNGKGYVLKVGMTIGKNDGRVIAITTSGIEIREQFRDDNGRLRKEIIKLSLPRKY